MSISLAPYLNFPQGKTREAMTFYQSVFGGKLDISTFGDFNMQGMPADGVMHAMLATDSFTFMASDAMPGSEDQWGGTRVYLTFFGDDLAKLDGLVRPARRGRFRRLAAREDGLGRHLRRPQGQVRPRVDVQHRRPGRRSGILIRPVGRSSEGDPYCGAARVGDQR